MFSSSKGCPEIRKDDRAEVEREVFDPFLHLSM